MKRFSLGTLSAGAAWFFTVFLVLWGDLLPYVVPALVFAVPCCAAYRKEPRRFWRPFVVLSVLGALGANFYLGHVFSREIDGAVVFGFPIPYLAEEFAVAPDMRAIANHVLISGVCLIPLAALSTFDTVRRARKAPKQI